MWGSAATAGAARVPLPHRPVLRTRYGHMTHTHTPTSGKTSTSERENVPGWSVAMRTLEP